MTSSMPPQAAVEGVRFALSSKSEDREECRSRALLNAQQIPKEIFILH